MSYTIPTGIPSPWVAPDVSAPVAPSPWTSEVPGYYYVDWQTGTDSGRTYGTPSAPRKTIPNPVPIGSRTEVHGEYNSVAETELEGQGTGDAWVAGVSGPAWIVGVGTPAPSFVFRLLLKGSYLYIENVVIEYPGLLQIGSSTAGYPADHILFRGSEIVGDGVSDSTAVILIGSSSDNVANVIMYDNEIHAWGDMATEVDQDSPAGVTDAYTSNVWWMANHAHHCTAGLRIGGAAEVDGSTNIYVVDNEVHDILQSGLFVKYSSNVVFGWNYVHDIIDTVWSVSKCVGAQYAPDGLWIIFNRLSGARNGVFVGGTDGLDLESPWPIYVIGNQISDISSPDPYALNSGYGDAAIMFSGSLERYAVGNTIYNVQAGINTPGSIEGSITKIHNNIISLVSDANHVTVYDGANDTDVSINNNLYHDTGGARIGWNGSTYTLAQLRSNTAQGDDDLEGSPQFEDAASGDFSLRSNSPAIDQGDATVIETLNALYETTFGESIAFDRLNLARPQNSVWDIGAYEFDGTPSDPDADSLLLTQTANTDPVTELWKRGAAPDGTPAEVIIQHSGPYPSQPLNNYIYAKHGTGLKHVFVSRGTITLEEAIAARP